MFDDFDNFSHAGFNQGLGGALAAYLTANQPKLAAQANYNQQQMDVQRHQQQVEQQRMQQMSQLLGQLNPTLGALYQGDPKNAGAIFQALQPTVKTNMLDEEIVRNPIDPLGGGTNQGQTNPNGLASYLNQQAPSMNSGMNNNQPSNIMPNQRSMPNKTVYERKLDIDKKVKQEEESEKEIVATEDQDSKARDLLNTVGIAEGQMKVFNSGAYTDWKKDASKYLLAPFSKKFSEYASTIETFDKNTNQLILKQMREYLKGLGMASDRDALRVEGATINSTSEPDANRRVLESYKVVANKQLQKNEAKREYVKEKGSLNGFASAWRKYEDQYPLTEITSNGEIISHPENLGKWQEVIFGVKGEASQPNESTLPGQVAPTQGQPSREQLLKVIRKTDPNFEG